MKKILAALCMLALMAVPAIAEETEGIEEETYRFVVQVLSGEESADVILGVDMDAAAAVALLGEPAGYFESESCAFQGMDKVYTYPSFVINTYPQEGLDLILSVYLMDDMYTTEEGAYIGMHLDEITAIYGEPAKTAEGSVTYEKGGCALAFMHDADGYVNAITYTSIAASAQ